MEDNEIFKVKPYDQLVVVVPKKVISKSVQRNKVKRRIRHYLRSNLLVSKIYVKLIGKPVEYSYHFLRTKLANSIVKYCID